MSGDYDDEERAFHDALHQAAEAEQFESLEPSEVKGATRRHFAWPAAGGVAAVAAVLALAIFIAPRVGVSAAGSAAAPSTAQVVPEAAPAPMGSAEITVTSADDGGGSPVPQGSAEAGPPREASAGEPAPGFRWVSAYSVAVQVPESWGEGVAPGTDWCATGQATPSGPFVDRGDRSTMAIACTGPVPASRLVMNVQFWTGGATGPELQAPWSYATVTVGDITVAVTTDGSQPALVSQILGSAVAQ